MNRAGRKAASGSVEVELEPQHQRPLGWAVFGLVVGALLIWQLGTVAVWGGIVLVVVGSFGAWEAAGIVPAPRWLDHRSEHAGRVAARPAACMTRLVTARACRRDRGVTSSPQVGAVESRVADPGRRSSAAARWHSRARVVGRPEADQRHCWSMRRAIARSQVAEGPRWHRGTCWQAPHRTIGWRRIPRHSEAEIRPPGAALSCSAPSSTRSPRCSSFRGHRGRRQSFRRSIRGGVRADRGQG